MFKCIIYYIFTTLAPMMYWCYTGAKTLFVVLIYGFFLFMAWRILMKT